MNARKRSPKLLVLHDDDALVAVVKPGGLPCVPDDSRDPSLLDVAKKQFRAELHVVHRLDRPVSGIVLFARNPASAAALSKGLRERHVTKVYWGVGEGHPRRHEGELVQHLRKDGERNLVKSVSPDAPGSKRAQTSWRVLLAFGERSLLELLPTTGRSHQLRVAASKLGCPLVGDVKYGASRQLKDLTIGLHARALKLPHPSGGPGLDLTAPLPDVPLWNLGRRHLADNGEGQPAG